MTAGAKRSASDEVARLEALLAKEPASAEFHKLADSYTRLGRFADAIRVCKQGLKHHPALGPGHVALGRAFFGAANLPKAIQSLRRALELPTAGSEAFRLLGEVLLWHQAPGEALAVLEEAVTKGHAERSIQALLERARKTLEEQATGVVSVSDLDRGIGNRAVAGTIGGTGVDIRAVPEEVTRRVFLPDEQDPTNERDLPEATPDGKTPRAEPRQAKGAEPPAWQSIDDQWSRQLDAQNTLVPDVDPEAPVPKLAPTGGVLPIAPLIDPLAEGMPPLPTEIDDAVTPAPELIADSPAPRAVGGAEETRATTARAESRSVEPETAVLEPHPRRETATPDEPETAVVGPIRAAPRPALAAASRSAPAPVPPQEDPEVEIEVESEAEAPVLRPATGPTLPPGPEPARGPEAPDRRLLEALALDAGPVDDRISQNVLPEPARMARRGLEETDPVRRGRRRGRVVLVLVLAVLLGGGGFLGWRHIIRAGELTLEQASHAAYDGSLSALQGSIDALTRPRPLRWRAEESANEARLLQALAWLEYRAGEPPSLTSRGATAALTQGAVALAENDAIRARSTLEKVSAPAQRSQRDLLIAWSSWIEGNRTEALELATAAARHRPELAGAHLLEAHLRREVGDLEGAEEAARRALRVSPRHESAALTLAGVLLEKDSPGQEVDALLGQPHAGSRVLAAWRKLLVLERQFRNGEQGVALGEIPTLIGTAPTHPALLFRAVQLLTLGGQFDGARELHDRLAKIRPTRDPAMAHLDAELQLAQGLEQRAVDALGASPTEPRLRRTLAIAELLLRRPQEALVALGDDGSPGAQSLRLLAAALADRTVSLDSLRQLAQRKDSHPLARLALAAALIDRESWTGAAAAAQDLATCPWYRHRGLTWLAYVQLRQRSLDAAYSLISRVVNVSPLFYPAQEIRGQILLQAGRAEEAAYALGLARKGGRGGALLLGALARAHALAGRAAESAAASAEAKRAGASEAELAQLAAYRQLAEGKSGRAPDPAAANELPYLVAFGDEALKAGRAAEAEKAWRAAVVVDPAHPIPQLRLASLHAEQKKETAPAELQAALNRAAPASVYSRSLVAQAQLAIARYYLARKDASKEVVDRIQAALKAEPGNGLAHRLLAEAYLASRRFKLARRSLETSAQLAPDDPSTFFLLGTAAKCERKRAQAALKRFLELEPKGKRAAAAKRALARAR